MCNYKPHPNLSLLCGCGCHKNPHSSKNLGAKPRSKPSKWVITGSHYKFDNTVVNEGRTQSLGCLLWGGGVIRIGKDRHVTLIRTCAAYYFAASSRSFACIAHTTLPLSSKPVLIRNLLWTRASSKLPVGDEPTRVRCVRARWKSASGEICERNGELWGA